MRQKRKRLLAMMAGIVLTGAALCFPGCSGTSPPETETEEEIRRTSAVDYGSSIEDYVAKHEKQMTGLAVGVVNARGPVYEGQFGESDLEKGFSVTEDTVFEWGSVTKLLVWVSVMQLVEAGKLDLKSDIRPYLPVNFLTNAKEGQMITLEHLMNHTAGFQEKLSGFFAEAGEKIPPLSEALQDHAPAQVFNAGEVTATSHWGAALAAYIVERASGEEFAVYVKKHIFQPLGMQRTAILPEAADNTFVAEKMAETASYNERGKRLKKQFVMPLYPAGMCTGTLSDMLTFAQALLPDNRTAGLFSDPSTLAALYLPTDLFSDGTPKNSHGFWNYSFGTRVLGQVGSTTGQSAALYLDTAGGIGVCVMMNKAQDTVFCREMMEVIFGSFRGSVYDTQGKLPSGRFQSARGIFRGPLLFTRDRASGISKKDLATDYWALSALADGRLRFEQAEADRIQVPFRSWLGEWLRTAWLALAILGTLGYLMLGILNQFQLREKRRRGRGREQPELVWRLVLIEGIGDLVVLAMTAHMAGITRRLRAFAGTEAITPLLAANGVLWMMMILLWISALGLFILLKRRGLSREKIPAFTLRVFLWLGVIHCGWAWQMMPFWNW